MLEEVHPGLEKLIADNKIAGAVIVVVRHGKLAHIEAVGYRDLASKPPLTEDTIFAIASMTKPITCIATMQLVEEGKYGLGFGLMIQPTPGAAEPVLDSYFWAGAYSTNFWVDPRRDIIGVVMTQVVPVTRDTQIDLVLKNYCPSPAGISSSW